MTDLARDNDAPTTERRIWRAPRLTDDPLSSTATGAIGAQADGTNTVTATNTAS